MDFFKLMQTKRFLDPESIKVQYEEGVFTAPDAVKQYLLGKMRLPNGYWEEKKTISEELGMPESTVKVVCHDRCLRYP